MARALAVAVLAASTMAAGGSGVSEEEEAKAVNTGVSVMLLGSIGFMMGLFYLVNQKDNDMRKYSWMVISSTISIFSAVLLFQAVNGVVEAYILGEHPEELVELFVSMAHFLAWFLFLQLVLGFLSGCRQGGQHKHECTEEEKEATELNLKTGGILLGHLTGFAAINAFGVLQQQLPHTFLVSLLCSPFAWMSVFFLGRVTQAIRTKVAMRDGKEDECEKSWNEEAAETENDVIGLTSSFMVVQAFRLLIGGTLPNAEGEEPEGIESSHSDFQAWLLCSIGLIFVVMEVVRIIKFPCNDERLNLRLLPQLKNIIAMDYAWCVFFSSNWFIAAHFFTKVGGMMQEITVALFVTAVALALIFILDKVEDMEATGKTVDSACRAVIKAISVLIGFSWEKAFDTAVVDFTTAVTFFPHPLTKLILALLLALLVVPAWRMHILPCVVAFEEAEEAEEEGDQERPPTQQGLDLILEASPSGSSDGSPSEPLLGKANVRKSSSHIGMDLPSLQKKCQAYKAQIRLLEKQLLQGGQPAGPQGTAAGSDLQRRNSELEQRNAQLEVTLAGITRDLADMQKMAELLSQ